ncbi:ankyrin repeat domain-containing protein [Candidatus Berkiella aquae]|uniref:Ankyrin repeat domain-containing protein n=1 Tax=Candidatus Berkiella aquae TaxID=295108 RepID=A0A0Q9YNP5_9GAMM|nr:ankyrin repeat domain-containing protein [Candidatus Berkiella aquae]MCS5712368.1 ankyrin repeat domain-containing protein [Candidatus Berkiella aquae]
MKRSRDGEEPSSTRIVKKRATESTSILDTAINWLLSWIPPSREEQLFSCIKNGWYGSVNFLIAEGVKLSPVEAELAADELRRAIRDQETDIARSLIAAGTNTEVLYDGMTSLHYAIKMGQTEIVQALLNAGANKEALYKGMTPLHFALRTEQAEIYKCFSRIDLLKIVNNIHVVKELTPKTIEILYFYFNRKRERVKSPTLLLDIYYFSRKTAHILGLEGEICFDESDMEFDIETRGSYAGESLGHLTEYVKLYSKIYPTSLFERIVEAFVFSNNLIDPCHNYYDDNAEFNFHKQYLADQLIYFSSGWEGHTVGLALYGNYLIYANRGTGGADNTGCRIFKINDTKLIQPDLIKVLIDGYVSSEQEFHAILARIIDLNFPVVSCMSKSQKHPTCSFVSPKAAIEAMIVLLQVGPSASIEKVKEQFTKELEREKYKLFTSFVRKTMMNELIKNMFYAKNKYLIAFYVALVKKIIYQHGGGQFGRTKDFEERVRACDLYVQLPNHIKNRIDEDKNFLQWMVKLNSCNKENSSRPIVHQMRLRTRSHDVKITKEYAQQSLISSRFQGS